MIAVAQAFQIGRTRSATVFSPSAIDKSGLTLAHGGAGKAAVLKPAAEIQFGVLETVG